MEKQAAADSPGIAFAQEFTPRVLGKTLGEDRVLGWLLEQVVDSADAGDLRARVAAQCFSYVTNEKSRRDMASHVFTAMCHFRLIEFSDDGVDLTHTGVELLALAGEEQDEYFGRHILAHCGGQALVEAIQRFELRGETPTLEELSQELGGHATSKSLSGTKAWLQRAGVLKAGPRYAVEPKRLEEVLGGGTTRLLGRTEAEVEFLLAVRLLHGAETTEGVPAAEARRVALSRRPDLGIPAKSLSQFVAGLARAGVIETPTLVAGRGGTRLTVRLQGAGISLSDEQVRGWLAQSKTAYPLSKLGTLEDAIAELRHGHAQARGDAGERAAIHVCLMLGLRVISWRAKLPAEIDVVAERTVAYSYQRWHVQVKNTDFALDVDRVDREVGAAAGTGASHILFVVPRSKLTGTARAEIASKNQLTHLHVFALDEVALGNHALGDIIESLQHQQRHMAFLKRTEAARRDALAPARADA
jgi:hypothetical protein